MRPSTTRSTAGTGFDFEDHVGAWLLLKMLTGQPIPGVEGVGIRLQMQVEALGWCIDDILLTTTISRRDERHLAISCKSNVQVTASSLPPDFVTRCWQQWAKSNPNPMQRGKDCLLLVTRGRNNAFMATWTDLKNAAAGTDLALALGRMRATATHCRMFESVKGPAKGACVVANDADIVAMVNSIAVVPLDFQIADSECEKIAIAQTRTLLVNGSLAEGARLWRELLAQAKSARLGSGTLEISDVWQRLRSQFVLMDHPDYEAAWRRLRALTQDHKATIETALSTGLRLDRKSETEKLLESIATDALCVVFGESGSGKSALVKATLNEKFPSATQVWFGPETLELALNEATRQSLGINQPLIDVLSATASTDNFLVIDAAERLGNACILKAKALIEELRKRNASGVSVVWHVLIIGQTEAWMSGVLQRLAIVESPTCYEVKELSNATVRDVLRTLDGLGSLATLSDAVSALTNLRALAWVVEAPAEFQGRDSTGTLPLTAIADRLWRHWTGNELSVHRLLVRLAEREAAFEHSFAISQLESGDAAVLDSLPIACPLRRDDAGGRVQFQHDLAADWARFQRLKEIAGDTAQWAQLAGNPFWHGALRMLGQLLLRQKVGTRCAWDVAFEAVESNRETTSLAGDILLDALFLDPNAAMFLDQRADRLLANGAALLIRLVKRFEHVASVPGMSVDLQGPFRDLSLYIEAHFRTPIVGRWFAMASFLAKHSDRIAKLTSPAIASLCERWLASTPSVLPDGAAVPFRREFAELALASARALQTEHAKGVIHVGASLARIYQAALAGASDLRSDLSEWALEMAQRRPYRQDVVEQVELHRADQAAEHRRRLASDPAYRERHERRRSAAFPMLRRRKLPSWPLGPKRRLDSMFREAVLRSPSFQALMRDKPAVAGEVLLACIIENEPEEQNGSGSGVEPELGIEFDDQGYPTAPWKSPFYSFLRINSDAALATLHQLVNFATDRWINDSFKRSGSSPARMSIRLTDGTMREYAGDFWVFGWSHQDSLVTGQLNCALAALERWLCDLIDAGSDVAPQIDASLQASNSVAVLGVLVNIGKYRAELFKGPLRPLLGARHIYDWDWRRAKEGAFAFDGVAWVRSGEVIFEMAKNWVLAPYRKKTLLQIVSEMVAVNKELGDFVRGASSQWISPDTKKEALEFRLLLAQLDYRNYSSVVDSATGNKVLNFTVPAADAAEIAAFEQDKLWPRRVLTFPQTCREFLRKSRMLNLQESEWVVSLMAAVDGDQEIDVDEEMKHAPRVAAAALLLMRASGDMAQKAQVQKRARSIIDAAIADIANEVKAHGPRIPIAPSHLEFAAYFAIDRWISEPSIENDRRVLTLLTCDDHVAVEALVWSAYSNRETLGGRWWRLLYLALLWSGLSILAPRYGDEGADIARWQRWRRWLCARSLSDGSTTAVSINPIAVAKRVERLELKQVQRRDARDHQSWAKKPRRSLSGGLNPSFLKRAFAWLVGDQADRQYAAQELETHRQLVAAFWAHQAWWQTGGGEDEDDDYKPMHGFSYFVLGELAYLIAKSPSATAPALWRPVFALGPKGHYAIGHFLSCWFGQITETTIVAEFAQRWRPMIEFMVLDDAWAKDGPWHYGQRLERQVLGFGASDSLKRISDHATLFTLTRDLFEAWANKRLTDDEDNLAGLCRFLSSKAAKSLRIDGLEWIADAMKANLNLGDWFRELTSNAFMEFLDVVVLEHVDDLARNDKARQALLHLAAHAVSRELPAALALQERIRRVL